MCDMASKMDDVIEGGIHKYDEMCQTIIDLEATVESMQDTIDNMKCCGNCTQLICSRYHIKGINKGCDGWKGVLRWKI